MPFRDHKTKKFAPGHGKIYKDKQHKNLGFLACNKPKNALNMADETFE